MAIFQPTRILDKAALITPELLRSMKIRALLLDVDNTLAHHNHPDPLPGIPGWLDAMKAAGIPMLILSNAVHRRVKPFSDTLGLGFISMALKPLPVGYRRAKKALGLPARQIAMVGDQVYTDILGANLCGMQTILVIPAQTEDKMAFRIRRYLERGVIRKYYKDKPRA